MKQNHLNNYLLMHCHKSITGTLDTVKIACVNEQRKGHFEKFEEGYVYVWVEDEPPPPTGQNAPPPLGLFALLLKKVIFCIAYSYLLLTYYVTY